MSVVLVTGAASGLGWAITQVYFEKGWRVFLADRDAELLATRVQVLADQDRVGSCVADLASSEGVHRVIDAVNERFGELQVLVNNAGITQRSLATETNPEVFRTVMAVDWQAPVELALGLMPLLRPGGSIINIGSMAGWMPVPGRAGYCSAKSALTQFFEVLRLEEAENNVNVLMVYPSFLDTQIEKNALGKDGKPAAHARSTVGRITSADDLALRIYHHAEQRKPHLFPDRFTWMASLLWRLWPSLYRKQVSKRFAVEMQQRGR